MSTFCRALSILVLLFSSRFVQAGLDFPAGLNPGDKYRIAFVTQGARDALSSDIAEYDAFVTTEANLAGSLTAGMGTTWQVIGSTTSIGAKLHTSTDDSPAGSNGVPIFLLDGTKIAEDYDDLWDSRIDSDLNVNQFGNIQESNVWSGTFRTGVGNTGRELGSSAEIATAGNSGRLDVNWIANANLTATGLMPLYGLSGEITAVPEPNAFLCIGLVGLAGLGYRRVKRRGRSKP